MSRINFSAFPSKALSRNPKQRTFNAYIRRRYPADIASRVSRLAETESSVNRASAIAIYGTG